MPEELVTLDQLRKEINFIQHIVRDVTNHHYRLGILMNIMWFGVNIVA